MKGRLGRLLQQWFRPTIEQRIAGRSTQELEGRTRAHRLCEEFFASGRAASHTTDPRRASEFSPRIWVYWAQGKDRMPPVVASCLKRLHAVNRDIEIVLLNDLNISGHIQLPAHVVERAFGNKTHFSDILRVSLLARHGGVWLDGTCFCGSPISAMLPKVRRSGFFAYYRNPPDPYLLSSWFMVAEPGHLIPTLLRDVLYFHWERESVLKDYFLLHFLFEALYNLHREFRKSWDRSFRLDAYRPHLLQGKLRDRFDPIEWESILSSCTIHKLTYKLGPEKVDDDSYLAQVLRA